MGLITWLVIGIILLAIIGLGWNTFLAGVKKGADKLGITSIINKAKQSLSSNPSFQIGTTIKTIACFPTTSPTQMFSWNWCVW